MAIWGLNASDVVYPGTKEKLWGTPLDPGEALARLCQGVLDMESSGNLVRISTAVTSEIAIKVQEMVTTPFVCALSCAVHISI